MKSSFPQWLRPCKESMIAPRIPGRVKHCNGPCGRWQVARHSVFHHYLICLPGFLTYVVMQSTSRTSLQPWRSHLSRFGCVQVAKRSKDVSPRHGLFLIAWITSMILGLDLLLRRLIVLTADFGNPLTPDG